MFVETTHPRVGRRKLAYVLATLALVAGAWLALTATDGASAKGDNGKGKTQLEATIQGGTLVVTGDQQAADSVVIRLRPGDATRLQVDDEQTGKVDFEFRLSQFSALEVDLRGGDDQLTLDESQGAIMGISVNGGAGNDTITGGAGNDSLAGNAGHDIILGKGGQDGLIGGADNDTLTGGDGDDQAFGDAGDDTMVWNPGDDTDLNEGGEGADTVQVNGGNGDEAFTTTANGTRVRFDRLNPAPFSIDIGTSEKLLLNMNGGMDAASATGNLAALIAITVDGGDGNDTILGSNGIDLLIGGGGDDFVDGQQGNDVAFLGGDDDTFQWDPGDGSDTVEGQDGNDTLLFNGSGGAEIFDVSANGGRVRFTRNLGNVVMDLDGVETIDLNALANTDIVNVNPMTGTDLASLHVDLAGTINGSVGDAVLDTVVVLGTTGADTLHVGPNPAGSGPVVTGTGVAVTISGNDPGDSLSLEPGDGLDTVQVNGEGTGEAFTTTANGAKVRFDRLSPAPYAVDMIAENLVVYMNGGEDSHSATGNLAALIAITVDGGDGNDTILGSNGIDTLIGGDGDDFVDGQQGNDVAFLGADDDTFQWDPGDGSDTVEGQDGNDTLLFNGSGGAEIFEASANGGRVRFTRNLGNVVMDLDDVESIDLNTLGNIDTVTVGEMTGTDLGTVNVNLAALGAGDAQVDSVVVTGTGGVDDIDITGNAAGVTVVGLSATVNITGHEPADSLTVNTLDGVDTVDQAGLVPGVIGVVIN